MVENKVDSIAEIRAKERQKADAELDALEQLITMQAEIAELQINTGGI